MLSEELRVIAAYHNGIDLADRLKAAEDVQKRQSEALVRAADEIDRLGNINDLIEKVEQWGRDRCIIPNSTPQAQLLKSLSEMGELADATLKSDVRDIIDGIGDVLVTLILYAALQKLDIEACLASAYDEIKDRKGTLTPEGVFVKEV